MGGALPVNPAVPTRRPAPAIVWRWSWALLGALSALPAALVTLQNPAHGLALAFGALPAAAMGVRGTRRSRYRILVVGLAIGVGVVVGATLASHPLLAVGGIFGACLGAAVLSARARIGSLLMMLAVPMVGAGLSFEGDISAALELAGLIALGAVYGWLLCLCWPVQDAEVQPALPTQATMIEYGVRLGLAGATCAGLGYVLDLDHKGWAAAACLLVMRPSAEMTRLRGAGRALSVTVGALAATALALDEVEPAVIAAGVVAALTGLAATRPSRWYLTGGFTTFIVILLLVYGAPNQAAGRFLERVGETLLGVGVALVFGVVWPALSGSGRRD